MAQSKIRDILETLKERYPAASEEELADRFMEAVRSDKVLHKAVLEEIFQLMSSGLERVWLKN